MEKEKRLKLVSPNILFATFSPWQNNKRSPTNGMVEPIISFFAPRSRRFVLIDQPHPGSDRLIPAVEIYKSGRLQKTERSSIFVSWLYPFLAIRNFLHTSPIFKLRDFLSVLDFCIRDGIKKDKIKYDLFIGLESINTLAGVLLKKFGFVKNVVYYVSDFSLQRYHILMLNRLYLFLDKLAFTHADFVWDVSPAMMTARFTAGLKPEGLKPSIYVPMALFPAQIRWLPRSKLVSLSLAYAGHLGRENGADLAIYAFKKVLRTLPGAELHIFATGPDLEIQHLRDLVNNLGVESKVFFHGLMKNQVDLVNDLRKFMVGLAPYRAIASSPRWWADAGKIRLYLAAGMPVVTTQVPPLGKELEEENSGLVVKDNADQIAKAVIKIFNTRGLYNKMRKNAIRQAQNNTWDKVYSRTLKSMGVDLG